MSKKNLPPIHRRSSVSFEVDNNEVLISDPLPPIIDKLERIEKQFNVNVAVQTDTQWLEQLKKDLILTLQADINVQDAVSNKLKSKSSTSRTQKSKISSAKSKSKSHSAIREGTEIGSALSDESGMTIPAYPEMQLDDEFGIALFNSSDEDDETFDAEKMTQIFEIPKEISTAVEIKVNKQNNVASIIIDAGLPTILKVSKELGSIDISPPLSADAFLLSALSPQDGEVCDFCKLPLKAIPKVKDQVSNSVDQAKLFCCQEYRELVEFALAQKTDSSSLNEIKQPTTHLIDISPHKSAKSLHELAETREKSERRIRERLLLRQQAALQAAQAAKMRAQSNVDFENDTTLNDQEIATRQMKIINYQLSSYKFIEDGWTVSPKVLSNFEMASNKEILDEVINMDYTKSIYDLFGQANLSEQCLQIGVIRQYYPDGKLFLVLFQDGKASIYYPSGNLAISIVCPSSDSSVICIIKEDSPSIDKSQAKILSVINTNGFGSFSYANETPRIVFNTLFGVELNKDGTKRRQWFWNGEPHVHAPPFQPVCFSINKTIGVRISSQNSININFLGFSKHININVGCKMEIPLKMRTKMHNMVKIETDKLQGPLMSLKSRAKSFIEKWNNALDHPYLVSKNQWPVKPFMMTKTASENKTIINPSMV